MWLEKDTIKNICLQEIKQTWLKADDSFPDFFTEIGEDTQKQNEQYLKTVTNNFQKQLKKFALRRKERSKWKQTTQVMIEQILAQENILGVHQAMTADDLTTFQEELKAFLRQTRIFAPELTVEDMGQAIRNYTVYAMIKQIHNVRSDFNMACFGYSLLYPFTDNYIDSQAYSHQEKAAYNQMIRDKIHGRPVTPETEHHLKTCRLLEMIESKYPRDKDETIFTLLSLMLDAQEDSLLRQNGSTPLTIDQRLDISLVKGGLSVMLDRFFVDKAIAKEDLIFYLGFGFFLQLADDLQDIKDDHEEGNQTLLTIDTSSGHEEKIVNKMLHFIRNIMSNYPAENETFKNFVLTNCYQLVYSSLARSNRFFSQDYLDRIEKYFPLSFSAMSNMRQGSLENADITAQERYMKIIDEMIE